MTLLWECPEMAANEMNWVEYNRHYLTMALAEVRACIERHVSRMQNEDHSIDDLPADVESLTASSKATVSLVRSRTR